MPPPTEVALSAQAESVPDATPAVLSGSKKVVSATELARDARPAELSPSVAPVLSAQAESASIQVTSPGRSLGIYRDPVVWPDGRDGNYPGQWFSRN